MTDQALMFRVQAEVAQAQAAMRDLTGDFQKFGAGAKAAMAQAATGNSAMANGFEILRASVDPAFAAMKRYQGIQAELAGMVERGETSQASANIVLEQAASRYMGVATAAERMSAAERESVAATGAAASEVAALQARFASLRASVDPAFAATEQFTAAQKLSAIAVRVGITTETEAATTLNALSQKLGLAGAAGERFAASQTRASASAHNSAFIAGNVAAQFNDIGVMLAAGQNPFQLAIQQGTQLSQVFNQIGGGVRGTLGALKAGFLAMLSPTTLLTVGIIAGGAALVQWATSADGAKNATKGYADALDAVRNGMVAAKDLESQYTDAVANGSKERVLALQDEARIRRDMIVIDQAKLAAERAAVERQMMTAQRAVNSAAAAVRAAQQQVADMKALHIDENDLQMVGANANVRDSLALLEKQKAAQVDINLNAQLIIDQTIANNDALTGTLDLLERIGNGWTPAVKGAHTLGSELQLAVDAANGVAEANIAGNISAALGPAAALAARLWNAAAAAAAAAGPVNVSVGLGAAGRPEGLQNLTASRQAVVVAQQAIAAAAWDTGGSGGSGGSGGGGGGKASASVASLSAESQKALDDLNLAVAAINEKVKAGLMSTADAADAVTSAKDKAANAVADLIAQIDKLGPAGHAAADVLRTKLTALAGDLKKPIDDLAKTLSQGLASPLGDFIKGTSSAADAFNKMGDSIIAKMIDIAMKQAETGFLEPLLKGILGAGGGFLSGAFGASAGGASGPGGGIEAAAASRPLPLSAALSAVQASSAQRRSPDLAATGGAAAGAMMRSGGNHTVNIQPPAGHEAVVSERHSGIDTFTEVVFQMIDGRLAAAARSGHGAHVNALADTFGLKRQPR